jgi:hypothetical protein
MYSHSLLQASSKLQRVSGFFIKDEGGCKFCHGKDVLSEYDLVMEHYKFACNCG